LKRWTSKGYGSIQFNGKTASVKLESVWIIPMLKVGLLEIKKEQPGELLLICGIDGE
jgi:hypothetical protein